MENSKEHQIKQIIGYKIIKSPIKAENLDKKTNKTGYFLKNIF